MRIVNSLFVAGAMAAAPLSFAATGGTPTGEFVTSFEEVASYAKVGVLGRRMMHGLVYADLVIKASDGDVNLDAYTVDPREEEWLIYVPEATRPSPHGVLIWYPADNIAKVPVAFKTSLEETGTILIVPRDDEEASDPITRRAAMGLHGLNWVARHYAVDPTRLVVGGEKEGANVAQRLASGFADVFRGAILYQGGARLGSEELPVPAAELVRVMRSRNALVLLGTEDDTSFQKEAGEITKSYAAICATSVATRAIPKLESKELVDALATVSSIEHTPVDKDCIATLDKTMADKLGSIDDLLNSNRHKQAIGEIVAFHIAYGGLAEEDVLKRMSAVRAQSKDVELDSKEMILRSQRGNPMVIPRGQQNRQPVN